ncbi:phosphotransferase [Streptomyces sp. NPDC091268]|uniref:phosphotransferase n=1 Tax=Streptomyces sp. NPDC091268 TaxID=3365979 RepID=UPI003821586F
MLELPQWRRDPVWVHSDLLPGNLPAERGRLSAVIDFGARGVGNPAVDVMAAWTVFGAETHGVFREAVEVDDSTWARGRGRALAFGLTAYHYYGVVHPVNPVLAEVGLRAARAALWTSTSVRDRQLVVIQVPLAGFQWMVAFWNCCTLPPASSISSVTA